MISTILIDDRNALWITATLGLVFLYLFINSERVYTRLPVLNERMVRVTSAFLNPPLQPIAVLDVLDFFTMALIRSCILLAGWGVNVTDVTVLVCQMAFLADAFLILMLLTFKRLLDELVLKDASWLALSIVNGGRSNFLGIYAFRRLSVLHGSSLAPLWKKQKRIMWQFLNKHHIGEILFFLPTNPLAGFACLQSTVRCCHDEIVTNLRQY